MKILIIEDSEPLRRSLLVGLNNLGFTVDESGDGSEGLSMALSSDYDLIILDLMLPNVDGMGILQALRSTPSQTRVLILSARSEAHDKINGLMKGADDYLTKPFSFEELHARVLALSRRGQLQSQQNTLRVGDCVLDLSLKTFNYQQQSVNITRNEYKIIECLFSAKDRVLGLEMISEAVVGQFDMLSKNALEAHISAVRKKVRLLGGELPIKNKRGFGYVASEN
ncbi:response regulator transcription factor [Pseudoalteromonas neustonica]|uniref:Response regulator transcription factor n=1 Tax=Pseudoalteromonas neustonica TaxID=1840331 RepID=A0ABU9TZJ8_9GAMM